MSLGPAYQPRRKDAQTNLADRNVAGQGSKRLYKDCGDNVGKGQLPAGVDSNLQRPAVDRGNPKRKEDFGPAHEFVRAMKEG
jgi:hypothetical protein